MPPDAGREAGLVPAAAGALAETLAGRVVAPVAAGDSHPRLALFAKELVAGAAPALLSRV